MTAGEGPSTVLSDVVSHTPEESLRRLHARAEPVALLLSAADEIERLVMTDLARGVQSAESLVRVADLEGSPVPRARARRALAQGLAYSNRFDEALLLLNEAIALAEGAGDTVEAARSRMTSLHALARIGRYAEAIEAGEAARAAFITAGDERMAARADANLGVTRRMSDDPARALDHFDRARAVLADQPVALAQLDSNRAEALLDLNRFADAERAFESARAAFLAARMDRAAAIVEGNLADLTARQGRLDAALEHFEMARRTLGQAQAPADAARLQAEQAEALASLGLFSEAVDQFRAAIPVLDTHKLAWEAARARAGLGSSLARLERYGEAAATLAEAADAFDSLNHSTGAARARVLQAEIARRSGDPSAADSLLDRALPALADRPALAAIAGLQRSESDLAAGHAERALAAIESGLERARRLGLTPLVADYLGLRARAHRAASDAPAALADLREAVEHVDRLRGTLRAERFRASFLSDRAALFEECVSAELDRATDDAVARAFDVSERSRTRSILDTLQSGPARPGPMDRSEQALLAELARLRAEMNALYASLDDGLSRPRTQTDHRRWADNVARLEREMTEIERRLASTARFSLALSRPPALADVLDTLSPDRAMVCYFAEGADLSAMVLRNSGARAVRRFAPLAGVLDHLRAFEFQVARAIARALPAGPPGERLRADADRELGLLYDRLVRPLEPLLDGARSLTFVPHAGLFGVPFHALREGNSYLLERREVSVSPSAAVWTHLHNRPGPGAAAPLILGFSDELAPEAEREGRSLAALPGAAVLLGPDATVEAARRALPAASLIHVASHARFSPGDPLNSGLKLADGWLTAREIAALRLDSPTVVLSGCNTGRSNVEAANEIWGLVRAFLVAGASTMIISLWPANDRTAAETMASFYANWYAGDRGGGRGAAAALCRAQAAIAQRGLHPAAWANFATIGRP